MFCPMLAVAMANNAREENEPLWFCQKENCMWYITHVTENGKTNCCAIVDIAKSLYFLPNIK